MNISELLQYVLIYGILIVSTIITFLGIKYVLNLEKKRLWTIFLPVGICYVLILVFLVNNFIISNIIVLLTAILGGVIISKSFADNSLVPSLITFSLVSSFMDIFSFSGGLTALIIKDGGVLLQNLSISFPIESKIVAIVGIGDLFIIGVIFSVLIRLEYTNIENYLIPTSGLLVALFLGLIGGGIYAVPFMALTTISYVILKMQLNKRNISAIKESKSSF